jgi:hypothetical protein
VLLYDEGARQVALARFDGGGQLAGTIRQIVKGTPGFEPIRPQMVRLGSDLIVGWTDLYDGHNELGLARVTP